MTITRRSKGEVTILDLTGRLIVSQGETETRTFAAAVSALVAEGRVRVVLNLAGLTSIDAGGLGEIAFTVSALRERGGDLTLVAPVPNVRKMISVTRLDTIVSLCESEQQATGSVRRFPPRLRQPGIGAVAIGSVGLAGPGQ